MSEPWHKYDLHAAFLDHPKLRALTCCVVCRRPKDAGLVVCWNCYREKDLRNGNDTVERILDEEEKKL